jgi:predicted component of type VI protein secretion system
MARIIFKFKDRILDVYPLPQNRPFTIGRRPGNDIVIDNLAVSGHHARIEDQGEGFVVVDLQSKNGTFLNGDPVQASSLQHQDLLVIGKHTLIVDLTDSIEVDEHLEAGSALGGGPSSFIEDQTMMLDTPVAHSRPGEEMPPPPEPEYPDIDLLTVLSGGAGELPLANKPITIGKNSDADFVIGGLWGLLTGSPAATINKQAGDVFLRFNGGLIKPKRNGSCVKGTIRLNHEDIVDVGPLKIKVQLSKRPSN